MANYIVDLKDKTADNISISGGKGANLSRLHSITGIHVPDGFVVTAQVYSDLVLSMTEVKSLLSRLRTVDADQTEYISQLSKQIRGTIEKISFSLELTEEIINALSRHGDSISYAVRSSATAEDLPEASFAGQQYTFLNVIGLKKICEAIVKCWRLCSTSGLSLTVLKTAFSMTRLQSQWLYKKWLIPKYPGVKNHLSGSCATESCKRSAMEKGKSHLKKRAFWYWHNLVSALKQLLAASRILNGVIPKMGFLSYRQGPLLPCIPCRKVLMAISIVPYL